MTEENKEDFNNLDNFELKDNSAPCNKMKILIIIISIILIVLAVLVILWLVLKDDRNDANDKDKKNDNEKKNLLIRILLIIHLKWNTFQRQIIQYN